MTAAEYIKILSKLPPETKLIARDGRGWTNLAVGPKKITDEVLLGAYGAEETGLVRLE